MFLANMRQIKYCLITIMRFDVCVQQKGTDMESAPTKIV